MRGVFGSSLNMWVCDVRHTASDNITSDRLSSKKRTNSVSLTIISTTILLGASLGSWELFSPSWGPFGRQQAEPAWSAATCTRTLSYSCLLHDLGCWHRYRSRTVQVVSASGNIRPSALSFASKACVPPPRLMDRPAPRTPLARHPVCITPVRRPSEVLALNQPNDAGQASRFPSQSPIPAHESSTLHASHPSQTRSHSALLTGPDNELGSRRWRFCRLQVRNPSQPFESVPLTGDKNHTQTLGA